MEKAQPLSDHRLAIDAVIVPFLLCAKSADCKRGLKKEMKKRLEHPKPRELKPQL